MAIKKLTKQEAFRLIFERRGERKIVLKGGVFYDLSEATRQEARKFAASIAQVLASK